MIHANNLEVAIAEKEKLQKKYPNAEIEIGHFGPVIGTHLGEKPSALPFQRNNSFYSKNIPKIFQHHLGLSTCY